MNRNKLKNLQKQSWKYHFDRRDKAAVAGLHLPTVDELLAGMSFYKSDFKLDAQIWAERLLASQKGKPQDPNGGEVLDALERITVSFTADDFEHVETAMRYYGLGSQGPECHKNSVKRCIVYRAMAGDWQAIALTCAEVAERFQKTFLDREEGKANLSTLLGLLFVLRAQVQAPQALVRSMKGSSQSGHTYIGDSFNPQTGDLLMFDIGNDPLKTSTSKVPLNSDPKQSGIIVFSGIGNDHTHRDREFAFEPVRPLINKNIPLFTMPPLETVRTTLITEYPHATIIVDRLLNDLVGRDQVEIAPTLFVGPPGSGKSSFAVRLCELLGIAFETFNCSSTMDNSFSGTARRWSSTEPAYPASLIIRTKIANPVIILDEIDKAGGSSANGRFVDSLLPMIEPSSAKNFHDNCLQAKVDLSGVNWLATCNDVKLIPKPLRDRFQIIKFPSPDRSHIILLADQIFKVLCADQAMDMRWFEKLSPSEIEALSEAWSEGSLRALKRLIYGVLLARDNSAQRH